VGKPTHLKPNEWEVLSVNWSKEDKHYCVEVTNFIKVRYIYSPYKHVVGRVLHLPKLD